MKIKPLNKQSTKIFGQLITGLGKIGDDAKIGKDGSAFMAVCVEVIDRPTIPDWPLGPLAVVSVTHYFKQHGDMCSDPDMTFLVSHPTDNAPFAVFPMTFDQSLPPRYDVGAFLEGGRLMVKPAVQADLTRFANVWMKNIREQQDLPAYVKSCKAVGGSA